MEGVSDEELARDRELLDAIAQARDEKRPVPPEIRREHVALRRAIRQKLDEARQ